MLVLLGLTLAVLAALLAGRLVWSSARRVQRWRERRARPDELAALRAERDRLKAEHAILARRMEMKLSELKARFVQQEADVSRARNRIGVLAEKLDDAAGVIKARDGEISELKAGIAALEDELEKRTQALHGAREKLREREEAINTLREETARLQKEIAERDRQLGILREEISLASAADAAMKDAGGVKARGGLEKKIEELNLLARQLETQRRQLEEERALPPAAGASGTKEKEKKASAADAPPAASAARGRDRDKAAAPAQKADGGGRLAGKLAETEKESERLGEELRELDNLLKKRLDSLRTIDEAVASTDRRGRKRTRRKARPPAGAGASSGKPAGKKKAVVRKLPAQGASVKKSAARKPSAGASVKKSAAGKTPGAAALSRASGKGGAGKSAASSAGKGEAGKSASGAEAPARNVVSLAARIRALKKQT